LLDLLGAQVEPPLGHENHLYFALTGTVEQESFAPMGTR
jgi:hypothetical protein